MYISKLESDLRTGWTRRSTDCSINCRAEVFSSKFIDSIQLTSQHCSSAGTTSNRSPHCRCLFTSSSPEVGNCVFRRLNFIPNCTNFIWYPTNSSACNIFQSIKHSIPKIGDCCFYSFYDSRKVDIKGWENTNNRIISDFEDVFDVFPRSTPVSSEYIFHKINNSS